MLIFVLLYSRCRKNTTIINCAGSEKEEKDCLDNPGVVTFYFLTLPSSVPIMNPGYLDLFSLKGPKLPSTEIIFKIVNINATYVEGANEIKLADADNFYMRNVGVNENAISIRKSIHGPQDIVITIDIKTFYDSILSASNQASIQLHVSKFNF